MRGVTRFWAQTRYSYRLIINILVKHVKVDRALETDHMVRSENPSHVLRHMAAKRCIEFFGLIVTSCLPQYVVMYRISLVVSQPGHFVTILGLFFFFKITSWRSCLPDSTCPGATLRGGRLKNLKKTTAPSSFDRC